MPVEQKTVPTALHFANQQGASLLSALLITSTIITLSMIVTGINVDRLKVMQTTYRVPYMETAFTIRNQLLCTETKAANVNCAPGRIAQLVVIDPVSGTASAPFLASATRMIPGKPNGPQYKVICDGTGQYILSYRTSPAATEWHRGQEIVCR